MKRLVDFFKHTFVTIFFVTASGMANAQNIHGDLPDLYQELRQSDLAMASKIEAKIRFLWKSSGSQTVDLLLGRGVDAAARGDFETATHHLTAVVDFAPDFATGYLERARAYLGAGLLGPAVDDLQKALRLDPNQFDAIAMLGQVFESLGDVDLARRSYEQALAIHPHFAQVRDAYNALDGVSGKTAL
jgi:tetratricopeptide (TPR) repeat protein